MTLGEQTHINMTSIHLRKISLKVTTSLMRLWTSLPQGGVDQYSKFCRLVEIFQCFFRLTIKKFKRIAIDD